HRGAQEPDHRDVHREAAAIDAGIESVRLDHRVIAVLGRPEDFAHDRWRLHHVMESVEDALRADGVVELRALVVVWEHDLDLGAGRGIAVELRFDLGGLVRLRLLGGLIEETDAHGLEFLLLRFERRAKTSTRCPEIARKIWTSS